MTQVANQLLITNNMSTSEPSTVDNTLIRNELRELSPLLSADSGIRFQGDDFRSLCGPQVYVFMRSGEPLYVGMSSNGIERPASVRHKQAAKARAECDEVLIYPCKSVNAAIKAETILISLLKPTYNKNKLRTRACQLLGVGHVYESST
jgi:hypothetical protein